MRGPDCMVAMKALAEETRLRILCLLAEAALSVNEIAARLQVTQYNASKHLKIMREAQLLGIRKEGKRRLYFVMPAFRKRAGDKGPLLDLGCCSFQLDQLLK